MYGNQKNVDDRYLEAGRACYTLNKYLNKWLNQTDIIPDDDERFLRRLIKVCSDVSHVGCNIFRWSYDDSPIYFMSDGSEAETRFKDIVSKLVDICIITEQDEYDELKVVNKVLENIWASNIINHFNPVPSDKEWFWRFKVEPKEVS